MKDEEKKENGFPLDGVVTAKPEPNFEPQPDEVIAELKFCTTVSCFGGDS